MVGAMRIRTLSFQVLAFSLSAAAGVRFEQSAKVIDRFDFVEMTLTVTNPPSSNPFMDAEVVGEFTPEGGAAVSVDGFCQRRWFGVSHSFRAHADGRAHSFRGSLRRQG